MKTESLNALITARTLFEKAQDLCLVDDKYVASAGLVILQDAIELFFYSSLIELGIDETKDLERISFNQLIGELKKENIKVPKSGTIKALNKQRVIIKHHGQNAEPTTVRNYYYVAEQSVNSVLKQVFGKSVEEIMLQELITEGESKTYITNALEAFEKGEYYQALVETRKAIFVEVENEYCIYDWKDVTTKDKIEDTLTGGLNWYFKGGIKAPVHTKNKEWIEQNVKNPFHYIQIDHDRMRMDLLEWGVSTHEFWNLWRLTPAVFRKNEKSRWIEKFETKFPTDAATKENALYCINRAISLISKMKGHFDLTRHILHTSHHEFRIEVKEKTPVYERASLVSKIIHQAEIGDVYTAYSAFEDFDGNMIFAEITNFDEEILHQTKKKSFWGYIDYSKCKPLETKK
jgi:hypothetical protein